jgi:hypothetical protein
MQTLMAHPKRSLFGAAIACAVGVGLLLVACEQDELPTDVPPSPDPAAVISDGAHEGGNPDFFFLPPLVPDPTGYENWDDGGFNPNYSPEVRICPGHPTESCVGTGAVARFTMTQGTGPEVVRVSEDDEHYIVNWDTGNVPDDTREYSIRVLVNGAELGFVDIRLGSNKDLKEMRNSKTGDVVPLKDGRTVPIKFRIEYALCDPGADECYEEVINAADGGSVILDDPDVPQAERDRFDVPAQPGDLFEVLDEEGHSYTTSFVNIAIQYCSDGFLEEPVGKCLEIESKPQILRLATPATVSLCEVEEQADTTLLTIYQKHDLRVIPIPHADDKCSLNIGRSESSGLMRFVDAGWRLVKRPLARVFVPQPLVASAPVVMHRGKGGLTGSTSLFEIGAPPDKFPGLVSWWTGDGHFKDIYGAEVQSDRNDGVPAIDFDSPNPGEVGFAEGIFDNAFDFGSSAGFVRVPTGYGITDRPLTELTLAAWVKLNSLAAPGQIQRFVTIAPRDTKTAILEDWGGVEGPDELHFAMKFDLEEISGIDGCDDDGFCHINVSNVLTAGSCFHHVAGTYGADGYMRLYLDSVEVGALEVRATPVSGDDPGFAFSSPDKPLIGLIDDVVVYNVALTASQIAQIRGEDAPGKCEPPEAGATIRGVVLYNEEPVTNYTNEEASIWVRNEGTGQGVSVTAEYSTADGTYTISGLEAGNYGVSVRIDDAEPYDGRPFAGDYDGWNSPIEVPVGVTEVVRDLTAQKTIHLTSPVDNGVEVGRIGEYALHDQSVVFEWDPIGEAVSYRVRVDRVQDSPYGYLGTELDTTITGTQIARYWPENAVNEHYEFQLYGYNANGVMVGKLMIVYENGHGWDYRFRIWNAVPVGLYTFDDGTADNQFLGAGALPDLVASEGFLIESGDAVIEYSDDYLELPIALGTSPFTVWIDATYEQSAGHAGIMTQGLPTCAPAARVDCDIWVDQYVLSGVSPNRLNSVFYGSAGESNSIITGIDQMDGSRRQIAITWDGADMGAFFDATLVTQAATGSPETDVDGSAVRFGYSEWNWQASTGRIHEIRIYDRALSEAELSFLAPGG